MNSTIYMLYDHSPSVAFDSDSTSVLLKSVENINVCELSCLIFIRNESEYMILCEGVNISVDFHGFTSFRYIYIWIYVEI